MPYVLLILLLASATCFGREVQSDSVTNALIAIPKNSLTITDNEGNELHLPYMYDDSKKLTLNVSRKTVKLINDKKQVLAEGQYTEPQQQNAGLYPTGHWRYYYSNGNIKREGAYMLVPYSWVDTVVVTDPVTGREETQLKTVIKYTSIKTGDWQYYNADGKPTSTTHFD